MARTLELDTITEPGNSGTANITLSSNTTTTMPLVDINGGAIDATTLGASTPSSVAATTLTANTIDTGQGVTEVYLMDQNVKTDSAVTFATVNTGQGANELYDMNQNVKTDSAVTFSTVTTGTLNTGQGANELYSMNQNVTTSSGVTFASVTSSGTINSAIISGGTLSGGTHSGGTHSGGTFSGGNVSSGTLAGPTVSDWGSNFISVKSSGSLLTYSWTGTENTAVGGGYTARYNRYGSQNVMVGFNAGQGIGWSNYSGGGSKNTCVGYQSGYNISSTHAATGYNNMCLGYYSGYSSSPSGSITTGSNIICLGDNNISSLYCADTSISSSDGRDKTDVEDFTAGLDWIEAMRPITYHWDKRSWYTEYDEETGEITSEKTPDGTHKQDKKHIGFIAQEVLAIEQANGFASDKNDMLTVNMNEDDTAYGMKYERLVPVLVNAIKELSAKVKVLEAA